MRKSSLFLLTTAMGLAAAWAWVLPRAVHGQTKPGYGFAAVPGEKGGWDLTGPYQEVPGWPKPMSQLPVTKSGDGELSKASSPKAPTGFSSPSAVSCPP